MSNEIKPPVTIEQERTEFKPVVITINDKETMKKIVNDCEEIANNNGEVYTMVELILDAAADGKLVY